MIALYNRVDRCRATHARETFDSVTQARAAAAGAHTGGDRPSGGGGLTEIAPEERFRRRASSAASARSVDVAGSGRPRAGKAQLEASDSILYDRVDGHRELTERSPREPSAAELVT